MHICSRGSALLAAALFGLTSATALGAQAPATRAIRNTLEYGIDAEAAFGVGDNSTVDITLPAARFRVGFPLNAKWSIEPAVGLSWHDVEGSNGLFNYSIEVGGVYRLSPFYVVTGNVTTLTRAWSPYVRPFANFTGFTDGGSDNEFTLGVGFGIAKPWRNDFAGRFEANGGYGFNNEVFRIGFLAGLSFFP
jgi:hypothetical protein